MGFQSACRAVGNMKKYTEAKIREVVDKAQSRSELWEQSFRIFSAAEELGLMHLIDNKFPKPMRFTEESALKEALLYPSRHRLKLGHSGLYAYLNKNKLWDKAPHLDVKPSAINDGIIDEILLDPRCRVELEGLYTTRTTRWKIDPENTKWRLARPYFKSVDGSTRYELKFRMGTRQVRFNYARMIYKKFVGPLSQSEVILFKDGNPGNIAPENLDKCERDKVMGAIGIVAAAIGTNPRYKLDEATAEKLRAERATGVKFDTLVKKYGIAKSTVSYVVNRKTWNRGGGAA